MFKLTDFALSTLDDQTLYEICVDKENYFLL